jgi:hypothetical protein
MSAVKSSLVALVLLMGLSTSAHAQYFATSSGAGFNNGYTAGYGYSGGYGNYAVPGVAPYYGGFGGYGYGPRVYQPGYVTTFPNYNGARTYNNLGGLMNTIQQQTGRPGSYRNGRVR